MRVQRNGVEEAFAVEKTGEDQWRVKEPFDDDADKYAVQGMTATLRTARADRVLEDPESDLINYGLDKPRLWATIRSGGAETTLQFGANHRIGNSIFAKLGDAPAVMVVPMSVYDAVAKSPDDFRDKTIFPSSFDDPERVELRRGGEEALFSSARRSKAPPATMTTIPRTTRRHPPRRSDGFSKERIRGGAPTGRRWTTFFKDCAACACRRCWRNARSRTTRTAYCRRG
ncbi:MAG: DUF4340 domain-containing protein [Deltaproteobacteria bacterium]|nr:DUF4340 domain-containing protein [Deltaproteobacteria bacterium]